MKYVCTDCGAVYSAAFIKAWGTSKESDGRGPRPHCVALVPNESAPKAEKRVGNRLEYETPMQVCGGALEASTTSKKAVEPTPILEA